ncbi:hypothetical protein DDZ13_00355 [Coraliomargarita sinensis]|uniref:DUF6922 domain-containing protein n=1 Tax=Coraliomargarita sinensis TaxID=2174842 RepID=A0A317ZPP2_9BACT|nr:hypothetical protein [Coraliomargarita sinensis]PXA05351.1 hypothetical protein DDZ13_00355 [Coraliomargarita sinensis]
MSSDDPLIAQLSDTLFWDTERSRLDTERHAAFIIVRTMERGTKEEVLSVWRFYGEPTVREALVNAPSLSPETIRFFANQFDLPVEAFRAHERAENWAS